MIPFFYLIVENDYLHLKCNPWLITCHLQEWMVERQMCTAFYNKLTDGQRSGRLEAGSEKPELFCISSEASVKLTEIANSSIDHCGASLVILSSLTEINDTLLLLLMINFLRVKIFSFISQDTGGNILSADAFPQPK